MVRVITKEGETMTVREAEPGDLIIGESFPGEFGGGAFPLRTTPSGEPAPTPTEPTAKPVPVDTTVRPSPISPALIRTRQQQELRERQIAIGTATRVLKRGATETETSFRERRRQLGASIIAGQPREAQRFFTEREAEVEAKKDIQKQIEKAQAEGKEVKVVPGGVRIKEILEPKAPEARTLRARFVEEATTKQLSAKEQTKLAKELSQEIRGRGLTFPERIEFKGAEVREAALIKLGIPLGKKQFEAAPITEFGKFALFAPFLATGAQQISKIPLEPTVKFRGVEQKVSKDVLKTDVIFTADDTIGGARGTTRIVRGRGGVQFGETTVTGVKGRPFVRIPDLKGGLKEPRLFFAKEQALVKPAKVSFTLADDVSRMTLTRKGFEQAGRGVTVTPTAVKTPTAKIVLDSEKFISASTGFTDDTVSFVAGKTVIVDSGREIGFKGLVTKAGTTPDIIETFTRGTGTKLISEKALKEVGAGIAASIKPATKRAPSLVTSVIATTEKAVLIPKTKVATVTTPIEKAVTRIRLSPAFIPAVRERVRTKAAVRIRLKEKAIQKEGVLTIPRLIQRGRISQRVLTAPRLALRLRGRAAPRGFIVPSIVVPKIPIAPPPIAFFPDIKKGREAGRRGRRRIQMEDIALSEGFIAKVTGLKPIKIKRKDIEKLARTPRALGIRRIPDIR